MPTAWPFAPAAIDERLSFGTSVRAAYAAERRTTFRLPTQKLRYEFAFGSDHEAAAAALILRNNPSGEWYVPVWHEATRIASALSASDVTLTAETDADYRASGKAIVWSAWDNYELVDVASFGSGTISLSSGLSAGYAAGSLVAPVRTALLPHGMSGAKGFPLRRARAEFWITDNVDLSADNLSDHESYDLLEDDQVVSSALPEQVKQALQLIDPGTGAFALQNAEGYVREHSTISMYSSSYSGRWAHRQFLHRRAGRSRPFWLPSWKDDLPLQTQVASGGTTAAVRQIDNPSDLVNRSVIFRLVDGTTVARKITAASNGGGTTNLTIAAPGVDVPTTATTSLMLLVRLASDDIELKHRFSSDGFVTEWSAPVVEVLG